MAKRRGRKAPASLSGGRLGERMLEAAAGARLVKAAGSRQVGAEDDGFLDLYEADRAIRPPLPMEKLLALAEENALHAAAINAKVTDAVGRGWALEREDGDEAEDQDRERLERELQAWMDRVTIAAPAPPAGRRLTFPQLVKQLVRGYEQVGWGVWEVAREGEEIVALYPLPGHTLRAVKPDPRDPDGPRLYVQVRGERRVYFKEFGERREIDPATGREAAGGDANEVLILQHYSERTPYYGIPPWVSGVPCMAELAAIREYNVSWFSSGGTGDRHMHVTAKDLTVAKELADSILAQMQEAKGVGHVTTISHGTEDTEVSVQLMSPEVGKREGQFRDRREDLAIEVLIAHQVPPYRVGWALMGSLGGSTAREALDAYRYGVIEPIQEDVESLLNATIFSEEGGGFPLRGYRFRFKDPDWSELEMELRLATEVVEHGMATPNEGRGLVGLDPGDDPALDRYYYQGQPISAGAGAREATDVLREFKRALDAIVQAERERLSKRRWR